MKTNQSSETAQNDSLFCKDGPDNDVALQTVVRYTRNLANFPFSNCLRVNDLERVKSIIFDSINRIKDAEKYHIISSPELFKIETLVDCGILDEGCKEDATLAVNDENYLSCFIINDVDHLKIKCIMPGSDTENAYENCRNIDLQMQQNLQYAASYEFGYLNSNFCDVGSGISFKTMVHLPFLALTGKIGEVSRRLLDKQISLSSCFSGSREGSIFNFSKDAYSQGSFFEISTTNSFYGTELDQHANFKQELMNIIEEERLCCLNYVRKNSTLLKHDVFRAYGISQFSKFITRQEAIDIMCAMKMGVNAGLIEGIQHKELNFLPYKIMFTNIERIIKAGKFNFEMDIADNIRMEGDRLRAILLQDELKNIILKDN